MTPEQAIVPPFLRRIVIRNFKSIEVCVFLRFKHLHVVSNNVWLCVLFRPLHIRFNCCQFSRDRHLFLLPLCHNGLDLGT